MTKAIVLTYAPITPEEKKLLLKTDIFKIACNWHAEELKPDIRLTLDDEKTIKKSLEVGNQNVVSVGFNYKDARVIERFDLPKRYSSLLACVDYLYTEGFDDILLVANNLQTNGKDIKKNFQKLNSDGINSLKDMAYIYKYRDEAAFDLPVMQIKDFIEMTPKNHLEPDINRGEKLLRRLAFSDAIRYEVRTNGLNNSSIESGELLNIILNQEDKEKILSGETEIKSGNLIIKRLI